MISKEAMIEMSPAKTTSKKRVKWTQRLVPYLLILPAFSVVVLFIVYPIVTTVIRSFQTNQTKDFTLANYHYFLTDKTQLANLAFTLKIVVITVMLALVFGYLLALYIRFSQSRFAKIVATLNIIPRFIPGLVAVYSVIMIIRDAGVLNRISRLFGYNYKPGLMYHASGIILMNLWFNIPFVALLILASLATVKPAAIEAAKDIGANSWQILRKIILPQTAKEVIVAMTFVFMGNVGSFTTPFLMGGNYPKMLGIALYDQFNSYMDYEKTAALSVIMFLLCSLSAAVYIRTNMKKAK